MKKIIDVQIGEVVVTKGKAILKSTAIGSCIAIAAYDARRNIGALAHAMLPGMAPAGKRPREKTKYIGNALNAIVERMAESGSEIGDIAVVVVGGANVLKRTNDPVCKDNINSTLELVDQRHLKLKARAVGGTERRRVSLDVEHGIISCVEGNGNEMQLWRAPGPAKQVRSFRRYSTG